jgi:predicted HAD superfamily phosphohydrolase YqeG
MLRYLKLFLQCLKNPKLLNPNLIIKDITELNPEILKHNGIKFIVFDKDNTLTITHKNEYYND